MFKKILRRRDFLKTISAGAMATLGKPLSFGDTPKDTAGSARPNIIIIQPDQHRGTVMHCAGDRQVHTPNLDRLAGEGIRFTNCMSASPVCSPFRGTLQTGLYCYQHGVTTNNVPLDTDLKTFAEYFSESGYGTGYFGKWHLDGGWPDPWPEGKGEDKIKNPGYVPPQNRQGWKHWLGYEKGPYSFTKVGKFDEKKQYLPVGDYDWEPAWHTDMALDYIRGRQKTGTPFLAYLSYGPPHMPQECPKKFLDMYPPGKFVLPPDVEEKLPADKHDEMRKVLQVYYAQVTAIDHEVGRLRDGLKKIGADKNLIIIYTSDHGDSLGSHYNLRRKLRFKGQPIAAALRTPLIVHWPSKIAAKQVCDSIVSSIDLAPTIMELGGFDVPGAMPGHSMARWCLKGNGYGNKVLYLGLGDNKPVPMVAINPKKREQWKDEKRRSCWRAAWDGRFLYFPGKCYGKGKGWLYDHKTDPYEMTNLDSSPEYLNVKKRLAKAMIEIASKTGDPALPALKQLLKQKGVL